MIIKNRIVNQCLWQNLKQVYVESLGKFKKKIKKMLLQKKTLSSMKIQNMFQLYLKIQTQKFQMRKIINKKIKFLKTLKSMKFINKLIRSGNSKITMN